MVKIYIVKRNEYSAFTDDFSQNYLAEKNIVITKNIFSADIVFSEALNSRAFRMIKWLMPFKKYITWTNEPRFDQIYAKHKNKKSINMNVFSGNVFLHNLHFLGSYHYNFTNNLGISLESPPKFVLTEEALENRKFSIAVFAYRNPQTSEILINGENRDLFVPRQELAYFLHKAGKADIVGNKWPDSVSITESSGFESGNDMWWDRKIELLQNYKFNICFENTAFPHYCTEKIWHAIASGCLPVYSSNRTLIYETFPKNSFVDASEFDTNEELLTFLENITPEEHIVRFNLCQAVMLKSCAKRLAQPNLKTDVIDQYILRINQLVGK